MRKMDPASWKLIRFSNIRIFHLVMVLVIELIVKFLTRSLCWLYQTRVIWVEGISRVAYYENLCVYSIVISPKALVNLTFLPWNMIGFWKKKKSLVNIHLMRYRKEGWWWWAFYMKIIIWVQAWLDEREKFQHKFFY